MASERRLSEQAWARLPVRTVVALAAAALGGLSFCHAMALAIYRTTPDDAHVMAPWDGRVTGALAEATMNANGNAGRDNAEALARLALRQDPTAVAGAATLILSAQAHGDTASARRLFSFADRLSRRDLTTRLWAIEDAVARGDIADALHDYDVALRTSRKAPQILFPVLTSAMADPAILEELRRTLTSRPIWTKDFIDYAAEHASDAAIAALLFRKLSSSGVAVQLVAQSKVIDRLVLEKRYEDAWKYYASVRTDADRRRSRDAGFSVGLTGASAFDWTAMDDGSGVSAAIQAGGRAGAGVLDFEAPPSVGGNLVEQLQLLPSGSYQLHGRSADVDQEAGSLPYWLLRCADGRELGRIVVTNSAERNGAFGGRLSVPADCPVQYLRLVAEPSNRPGGLTGQITTALLQPA